MNLKDIDERYLKGNDNMKLIIEITDATWDTFNSLVSFMTEKSIDAEVTYLKNDEKIGTLLKANSIKR